jgi:hypothetical protein
MFSRCASVVVAGVFLVGLTLVSPASAGGGEPAPTVTGPVPGPVSMLTVTFDPASKGYEQVEYFLSGDASAYEAVGSLKSDGKWKVTPTVTAPYTTRVVVYRPIDPNDFNGTVFVEWLNVSAGFESTPDWAATHNEIMREGAAWVGVSAQVVGVQGGADVIEGAPPGGLKAKDPARYGSLSHPGDQYSYDIFTQAGRAVADGGPDGPLGGLDVQRVIAMGESQSAFRMVTYINAIQPQAGVYDGFLVHSRSRSAAGLGSSEAFGLGDDGTPDVAFIRKDNRTPVLTLETETDLETLGFIPARQADSTSFRLWEVAGTSHADAHTAGLSFADSGDGQAEAQLLDPTKADGGPLGCAQPMNSGPHFAVTIAALHQLERWVKDGTPPPKAPRLELTADATPAIARDEHGNALGGIRTGQMEAPLATINGLPNAGGSFCRLFGNTTPFDAATLAELYPSKDVWLEQFTKATNQAVKAGFLLRPEADHYLAAAEALTWPAA